MIRRLISRFAGFAIVAIVAYALLSLFPTKPANGQAVDKAAVAVANTEKDIAAVVKRTQQLGAAINNNLDSPDGRRELPGQLTQFQSETSRLQKLLSALDKDADAYDNARSNAMKEFESHMDQIRHVYTKRKMERLHDIAYEQSGNALMNARASAVSGRQALEQSTDLEHVAACIKIGSELETDGHDLDLQVQNVKTAVAEYTRRTEQLLAALAQGIASAEAGS